MKNILGIITQLFEAKGVYAEELYPGLAVSIVKLSSDVAAIRNPDKRNSFYVFDPRPFPKICAEWQSDWLKHEGKVIDLNNPNNWPYIDRSEFRLVTKYDIA